MGEVIQLLGTNYFFTAEQQALFTNANPGEFSNVGRNYFIGPKQYQLVVNAKALREMGISVPPTVLLRADRVIE